MRDEVDPRLSAVSGHAAARIVPLLVEWFAPTSVVDLGCAEGRWLRAFMELGVSDVVGLEKMPIAPSELRVPADRVTRFDLDDPIELDRTFDLALCLEVAEHLAPRSSERLVDELVALAPAVVFSAGVPGQGGEGHVNEQWGSMWEERFATRGFALFDVLRARLWDDDEVQWWYTQNIVVYARPDHAAATVLRSVEQPLPIDIVHPRMFEDVQARPLTTREIARALPAAASGTWRHHIVDRLRRRP